MICFALYSSPLSRRNFETIASFNGSMPDDAVYFVNPLARLCAAACLICSGVSKSGSPAPKRTRSRPAACRAFAFAVMARVGDGAVFRARDEMWIMDVACVVRQRLQQSRRG